MQRVQLDAPPPVWVGDHETLAGYVRGFRESREVAIDTETTGLDLIRDLPLYVSIGNDEKRIVIPAELAQGLSPLMDDPDVVLDAHNAKFDAHMLANIGVPVGRAKLHCTLVAAGMSDSSRSSLQLKDLAVSLYGEDGAKAFRYKNFVESFGRPKKGQTAGDLLKSAPRQQVMDYVANDVWVTYQVKKTTKRLLEKIVNWRGQTLWEVYNAVEVPFTRLLWDCERKGIRIDRGRLSELDKKWSDTLMKLERDFSAMAGRPINLNSPQQLRQYFLGEKGLTTNQFTKGGESGEMKYAVNKETLDAWAAAGVQEAVILKKHRELSHLRNIFVLGLLQAADVNDRVHTTYNQVGAETGRLSSSNPNLQNIPVRSDLGKYIRECFIPTDDDHFLIVRDYDQLEMRLAAALSGDPEMINIINSGKDIHAGNASIAFDVPYEDIMDAVRAKEALAEAKKKGLECVPLTDRQNELLVLRFRAKTIGFGVLYGEGIFKLALQLGISVDEAKQIRGRFFSAFKRLIQDVVWTQKRVQNDLSVQTILGRVRALPAAALGDGPAFFKALRQAYNTRVQGTAADVAKLAMLRIWSDSRIRDLGASLLLQVHDELILDCPHETAEEVNEIVGWHMENCLDDIGIRLPVRLTSSGGPCRNWAEGK